MKGIIIYDNTVNGINAVKLKHAGFDCAFTTANDATDTLTGVPVTCITAKCSKDDTYDFEIGALIALMKMCGVEKVKKAAKETFFDVAENSVNEYEEEIKILKEENEKLQHDYDLCLNSENALKITTQLQNKSIEKLTKAIDGYKEDLYKVAKRCRELEAKEDILNKQEETINKREEEMSVYFGGRGCGKQYKALVALFKKLDQKKVDAAYKEAYNTTLPLWQKEALRQAYEIRKENIEKSELPRTLDINGTKYRKMLQIKDYGEQIISKLTVDSLIEESRAFRQKCVDEWLCKPPTKREEIWDEILKEGRTPVYVKREDIHDFLEECQMVGIKWTTGNLPVETIPFHMSKGYDGIYFFVMTSLDISKSTPGAKEFRHVMSWWMTACPAEAQVAIHYIRPMRWDLFKKGRIVIGCTEEEVPEFIEKAKRELGNIRIEKYSIENLHCNGPIKVYYHYDKDINWMRPLDVTGIPRVKINNHKVIHWEDVK